METKGPRRKISTERPPREMKGLLNAGRMTTCLRVMAKIEGPCGGQRKTSLGSEEQ